MIRIIAIHTVSGDLKRFVIDHDRNGSMLQPGFNQIEAGEDLLHLFWKCVRGNVPVLSGEIASYIITHGTTNKECLETGCLQHLKYGIHLWWYFHHRSHLQCSEKQMIEFFPISHGFFRILLYPKTAPQWRGWDQPHNTWNRSHR